MIAGGVRALRPQRRLSLAPGNYKIKAELEGFSPVEYPHIVINVGRNTNIEVTMNSAVEDTCDRG